MMFEAEFRAEIGKAIPRIVECLNDSDNDVRSAAAQGLSSLGAYRTCPAKSLLLLNDVRSGIAGGDWQGHTSRCRMSEGFRQ